MIKARILAPSFVIGAVSGPCIGFLLWGGGAAYPVLLGLLSFLLIGGIVAALIYFSLKDARRLLDICATTEAIRCGDQQQIMDNIFDIESVIPVELREVVIKKLGTCSYVATKIGFRKTVERIAPRQAKFWQDKLDLPPLPWASKLRILLIRPVT
jgi:hypothetical protein